MCGLPRLGTLNKAVNFDVSFVVVFCFLFFYEDKILELIRVKRFAQDILLYNGHY